MGSIFGGIEIEWLVHGSVDRTGERASASRRTIPEVRVNLKATASVPAHYIAPLPINNILKAALS